LRANDWIKLICWKKTITRKKKGCVVWYSVDLKWSVVLCGLRDTYKLAIQLDDCTAVA
jgi:hypothetical protein